MSHNILTRSYPLDCNRKQVQAAMNNYAAMEDWQEGCTGVNPIRWLENVGIQNSYEDAEEKIGAHDKGWYDCLAVRYYETPPVAPSKTAVNAANAVRNAQNDYNELKQKIDYAFWHRKSEFVGCKECGSKLKISLLKKTNCPLCGRNLLSETDTERLMRAHDRIVSASKKQKDEALKQQARAEKANKNRKVRWLVKIEYHT